MQPLAEVVKSGDRREILEALRDRLAAAIDADPDPRDLAALSLRFEKVVADLEGLGVRGGKESVKDALAARRKAKQAAAG